MVSISLDLSLFIQLANFIFLIVVLNYCLYRPILRILNERKELFARLKDKAAKAKSEIDNSEAEKARLNAESLRQALSLRTELISSSLVQEKAVLAKAQEAAVRQINDSRSKIQQSTASARAVLSEEIKNISKDMAAKILGRAI